MFGRRKKVAVAAGAQAPSFRLTHLDGSTETLDDILARGPVLLAFFKISCPVCQLSAPYLDRLAKNSTLQIIGVSQDDAEATRGFRERLEVTFPTLLDLRSEGYPASNAYGITSVPTLFLLERDGVIAKALNGFSRRDFEEIGARVGVSPFGPDDHVPEWKAG